MTERAPAAAAAGPQPSGAVSRRLVRPLTGWWVFTKRSWFVFFLREITCLGVAYFAVLYLAFVRDVAEGPAAYDAFVAWTRRPWVTVVHAVILVATLWHTITWFVAAPTAMGPRVLGASSTTTVPAGRSDAISWSR